MSSGHIRFNMKTIFLIFLFYISGIIYISFYGFISKFMFGGIHLFIQNRFKKMGLDSTPYSVSEIRKKAELVVRLMGVLLLVVATFMLFAFIYKIR